VRRPALLAAAAAVAFAVLAVLVSTGGLTSVDQYAVNHLMPGLAPGETETPLLFSVLPIADLSGETGIQVALNLFTLPASVAVSGLVVGAAAWTLRRRGRKVEALAWVTAWLAVNAAEVLTKSALARPHLGVRHRFFTFAHAFPSGHMARGLLVAAVCASVWPATRRYAVVWAALVPVALVAAGFHTPSDVLGGALLALIAIGAVKVASRRWEAPAEVQRSRGR
jgi:membrane-associated phospholipid phosphatase